MDTQPTALTLYSGDSLSRAKGWTSISESERRRRAMAALRDRDVAELYDLLAAYLVLYSGSGTKISKHTLRSYKTGIACLLSHWKGESLVRPGPTAASIYVRTLETEGLSAGTVTVRLAAARALYKALRW